MKHGDDWQNDIAFCDGQTRGHHDSHGVQHQASVGVHHALGQPSRALDAGITACRMNKQVKY